jgi:hypothetical protein
MTPHRDGFTGPRPYGSCPKPRSPAVTVRDRGAGYMVIQLTRREREVAGITGLQVGGRAARPHDRDPRGA